MKSRIIWKIAKTELSLLFYSPIAWILLIIFSFQTGTDFLDHLHEVIRTQEVGSQITGLTATIFTHPFTSVLANVQKDIYLYIPLLTMGSMSREFSTGSIKLLFSSPVRESEMILGKYIAMAIYGIALISILIAFMIIGNCYIGYFDIRLVLSGILGLYLLICAYIAIGLFMSTITSYQVVAAISTFVLLTGLNYVGNLWQRIDFIRDITYYLSIQGRAEQFIKGLITSVDTVYFLITIGIFLSCAILTLQIGRRIPYGTRAFGYFAIPITIAFLVGYITSRPALKLYFDMTRDKSNTLTAKSRSILKRMPGPLNIHTYVNILDVNSYFGMPENQNDDRAYFDNYRRFKSDLSIDYLYYYDSSQDSRLYSAYPNYSNEQLARRMADIFNFDFQKLYSPGQMRNVADLRPEEYRFVRHLEYGGREAYLRVFNDILKQPGEAETTAALERLTNGPCHIAYVTGQNERSVGKFADRDYKLALNTLTYRASMINQGFDILPVNLDSVSNPLDADILVIADPIEPFSRQALNKILAFVEKGGNFLITASQDSRLTLRPLLDSFGLSLGNGTVLEHSRDFAPTFVFGDLAPFSDGLSPSLADARAGGARILLPSTVSVNRVGKTSFDTEPLLYLPAGKGWVDTRRVDLDTLTAPMPTMTPSPSPITLGVALHRLIRNKVQRGIVIGCANFMDNQQLTRNTVRTGNSALVKGLFYWLSDGEYPIEILRPVPKDDYLRLDRAGLSMLRILILELLPALLVIGGSVLLIYRKRR